MVQIISRYSLRIGSVQSQLCRFHILLSSHAPALRESLGGGGVYQKMQSWRAPIATRPANVTHSSSHPFNCVRFTFIYRKKNNYFPWKSLFRWRQTPWMQTLPCEQADRCKNITFPQLRLRTAIISGTDPQIFQAGNKWQRCLEFRVMFRVELLMFFPTTFSKDTWITYCHSMIQRDVSIGTDNLFGGTQGSIWPTQLSGNGLYSSYGTRLEGPQLEWC